MAPEGGPYSMLTNCYDNLVSISAIRFALKRVTIRKVDLFYNMLHSLGSDIR